MTANDQWKANESDPLGLRGLDAIEPGYDGWAQIESALRSHNSNQRSWQKTGTWLALAAGLVLVIGVVLRTNENLIAPNPPSPGFATSGAHSASVPVKDNISALIGISQSMEEQVARLRQESASMPAESAIYVAELEDLIAQVDNQLSLTPDSIDLWGQRVNLLLDLAQIYQQQWEIDYGRMASL
jgi:hypothetical protein